jgi:hypothetical protein
MSQTLPARVKLAFLISPLAAVVVNAGGVAVTRSVETNSIAEGARAALHSTPAFFLFGLPIVYVFTLLAGMPGYQMLWRRGLLRVWPIVTIGTLAGTLVMLLITRPFFGTQLVPDTALMGGIMGASIATVFALIALHRFGGAPE